MIFEVITAVNIAINAVWDVTPCSLVDGSISRYIYLFGSTSCLLQNARCPLQIFGYTVDFHACVVGSL